MPSAEVLAVLADEVTEAGAAVSACLARLADTNDEDVFREANAEYIERVQRVALASDALNLAGLKSVCDFVERNLAALTHGRMDAERAALFERWPQLVLGYLKTPLDRVYSRELAELFQRPAWPESLDLVAAQALEQQLITLNDADEPAPSARECVARPEDVVLEIPNDVHPKLIDAFLTEGPQQAAEYAALIQSVVRGEGWIDELNECRRLTHALKGAGNTVGVRGVATLCHHVEDLLEFLVEHAAPPRGDLGRLLVKVADTLEMMFEALLGTGARPADAQDVLQAVLDWANRIDRGELDPAMLQDADAETREPMIPVVPAAPRAAEERRPPPVSVRAEHVEPRVRVAVHVLDELLRTSGELRISSAQVRAPLQQLYKACAELRERHAVLWDRSHDMEAFVSTQGIATGRRQAAAGASDALPLAFDPLELDQYSELHTYVQGFSETVADLQMLAARFVETLGTVDAAVNQQVLLNNELHDLLMASRMAPAGQLEARLQRAVRQAAEQCGKQVELRLEGKDVRVDDQMINALIDPLQHLLRNAVDHGVEAAAARAQAGKSAAGEIVLRFARDGNYLLITCSDDGAGLDSERIRTRALALGLIREQELLREDEIARLILRPGFSTAKTVTEVSGRGVGMNIVHTSVVRLKGTLDIRTQAGSGTTFVLRVPMSLGIAHCLLVVAAGQTFALPTDDLHRIVYDGARAVQQTAEGWYYGDDQVRCPAHPLPRLLGYTDGADGDDLDKQRHVVLMNDVSSKHAIVVDAVVGGIDLVIKSMGRYLGGVRGVLGASILGDGLVVPILALADLLRVEHGGSSVADASRAPSATASAGRDILVVDDSLSVRTALATLLAEEGFEVRTAKDGLEAIEAIGERLPTAVLADLEMPRMNGLELTTHLRAQAATRNLPVIMVTSRTAEKHRHLARAAGVDDYLTKPYREQELLLRLRTILSNAA